MRTISIRIEFDSLVEDGSCLIEHVKYRELPAHGQL